MIVFLCWMIKVKCILYNVLNLMIWIISVNMYLRYKLNKFNFKN